MSELAGESLGTPELPPIPVVDAAAPAVAASLPDIAFAVAPEALKVARSYLQYADAILISVDEPVEGGRNRTTAQLLLNSVQTLTAALAPFSQVSLSAHPFWNSRLHASGTSAATFEKLQATSSREALSRDEVKAIRRTVWNAIEVLSAPDVARVTRKFATLAKVIVAVIISVVLGVIVVRLSERMMATPHLLTGKPFRTSSGLPSFQSIDGVGKDLLFHTEQDVSPWVEYDLGQPTVMKEVFVKNRSDCCDERAIPMVVEVSDDRATWKQVAERREPFKKVTLTFEPVTARYLRLRVLRPSFLHLEGVEAR